MFSVTDMHDGAEVTESEAVELHPDQDSRNERLDRYIVGQLPELSRNAVQALIDDGHVLVDGIQRKPSFKVTPGEVVVVDAPLVVPEEVAAENIPLDILHEDDDVIVLNKAAGMVVHPAPGHATGTLVNALRYYSPEISSSGMERSGIVHRLDKDTSGVMIVAKHDQSRQWLQDQWLNGAVGKQYVALAHRVFEEEEAVIDVPIARHKTERKRMAVEREGRSALTVVNVRERYENATLLDVDLRTGRTHQIRVHLAFIKHPILGDSVYGTSSSVELSKRLRIRRQQLHAVSLRITLPSDGKPKTFTAPVPADMGAVIQRFREGDTEDA